MTTMSTNIDKDPIESSQRETSPRKNKASSFICDYGHCNDQKFRCIVELGFHVRNHGLELCPGCDRFGRIEKLEKHFVSKRHIRKQACYSIEGELVVAKDTYCCDLCGFNATEISSVVDHYWSHSRCIKKKKRRAIEESEKAVLGAAKHYPDKRIAPVCGEATSPPNTLNNLSESLYSQRSGITGESNLVGPFTCIISKCKQTFSCIQTFMKHVKSHGIKTQACPVCASEFITKMQLEKHFLVHSKNVSSSSTMHHKGESTVENLECYACELCGHSARKINMLLKHYLKQHVVSNSLSSKNTRMLQMELKSEPNASETSDSSGSSDETLIYSPGIKNEAGAGNMEFEFVDVPNSVEEGIDEVEEDLTIVDSNDFVPKEENVGGKLEKHEEAVSGTVGHWYVKPISPVRNEPTTSNININSSENRTSTESGRTDQSNRIISFSCGIRKCKRKFSCIQTFREHAMSHHGVRHYFCPICGCEFNANVKLEEHYFSAHTKMGSSTLRFREETAEQLKYACELCDYSSLTKNTLLKHHRKEHVVSNSLSSKNTRMLQVEVKSEQNPSETSDSRDPADEALICSPDIKTEANTGNVEFEFVDAPHSVEEDVDEVEEGLTIADSDDVVPKEEHFGGKFEKHEEAVSGTVGHLYGKPIPPVYDEATTPNVNINPSENRISTESGTTDQSNHVISFNCGICKRKFSCIQTFMIHEKSHEVKPQACPVCASEFITKMLLEKHFLVHTKNVSSSSTMHHKGESTVENVECYACELCGHSAHKINMLLKHYLKQHVVSNSLSSKNTRMLQMELKSEPNASETSDSSGSSDETLIYSPDIKNEADTGNMEFEFVDAPHSVEEDVDEVEEGLTVVDSDDVVPKEDHSGEKLEEHEKTLSGTVGHLYGKPIPPVCDEATTPNVNTNPSGNRISTESGTAGESNHSISLNCGIRKCKRKFGCIKTLREHAMSHGVQNYFCPICSSEFSAKVKLEKHILAIHTEAITCTFRFRGKDYTEERINYLCGICDYSSFRMGWVMNHYQNTHLFSNHLKKMKVLDTEGNMASERLADSFDPSEQPIICSPKTATQSSAGTENMEFEFVAVPNSVEDIEDVKGFTTDPLEVTNVDSEAEEFERNSCGNKTDNRRSIGMHVRADTNAGNGFICKICGFITNTGINLRRHNHKRHSKYIGSGKEPVERFCPVCGYICPKESFMKAHMAEAHFVGMLNAFVCGTCGKRFDTSQKLISHLASGNYVCGVCDFKSRDKCGLESHKKSHKKQDFPCDLCDFMGITAASLIMHKKYDHKAVIKQQID